MAAIAAAARVLQATSLWHGGEAMGCQWVDCDRNFISKRYDRIAGLIGLFEWLLFMPPMLRKNAAHRLNLRHGHRVLELGCGTGRNLSFLRQAVGPHGRVYGVDLSAGMLRRAQDLREHHQWTNVELIQSDAADFVTPEPLDGVLFSLSYNTMPHHLAVLRHAWKQLRPGGRLVIMDAKAPAGLGGKLALRFGVWLMKHTLLGNPFITPWNHMAALADEPAMEEFLFGSYYICHGSKPAAPLLSHIAHPLRQVTVEPTESKNGVSGASRATAPITLPA